MSTTCRNGAVCKNNMGIISRYCDVWKVSVVVVVFVDVMVVCANTGCGLSVGLIVRNCNVR